MDLGNAKTRLGRPGRVVGCANLCRMRANRSPPEWAWWWWWP
ncbi:hypothetical protein MBEBAB_2800 [Brevundimonas abyssalis TAR-001]|uniref:Uncharacterized protein n=1 Tax=Brevundimonas abyssalis TAR-001 TaxID=1391729 RepID=A0A8E0TSR7_9CAUL|nr:hypothetical protein MBEBAB_2800 [Brevundimonas abyssalis TAR-001]